MGSTPIKKVLPMNFNYLLKHSELFPSVIGITQKRFEQLFKKFEIQLKKAESCRAWGKERIRIPGGGRKATLKTDRQKLFFILFYYKTYPTFRLAQSIFCFDKRNIQLWKNFLEKVLQQSVEYQLNLPKIKARYLDQVIEVCPKLKSCLVDATERRINRPKYNQEFYYSGKKKCHTIKNQIYLNSSSPKILAVSDTVEGKKHDKQLTLDDPTFYTIPPGSTMMTDLGYLGLDNDNKRITKFITPYKKPRGKELSDFQKQNNKQISSIRVRVEHPFAWMKHFHILKHQFRGRIKQANTPFKTIACLYNFNLAYK